MQSTDRKRVKFIVSYDGSDYCGWQRQKEHSCGPKLPSIQQTLESALKSILNEGVAVSASGRTDAGVHAKAQVCHFDTSRRLPRDLCWALKSKLPTSIAARGAWLAPLDFHSTLSAQAKTYQYYIWNHNRPTALMNRYSWWIRKPLDLAELNQSTLGIIGQHDFASFQSVGTPVAHTVRQIYAAHWKSVRPGLIVFEVKGSGFLKQMVRNIVGTLIDFHLKGQDHEKIQSVMEKCDRRFAGPTAPAQGLFLKTVYYSKELDRRCVKI